MNTITLTAYQLFVGPQNDSKYGTFTGRAVEVLDQTLQKYFARGYTVCDGKGAWSSATGKKFWQHCKVITVFVNDEKEGSKVDSFIGEIKHQLEQLAVAKVKIGAAEFR